MAKAEHTEGMSYKEYLDKLKPDDEILYVESKRGFKRIVRLVVERRTTTQIVMKNGSRYRASDGKLLGGTCFEKLPFPAPDDEMQAVTLEYERGRLAMRLEALNWRKIPLETLRAVAELLPKDTS